MPDPNDHGNDHPSDHGNDHPNDHESHFEDAIDPNLVARLAAWFGEGPLPAVSVQRPMEDEETRNQREALETLLAVADSKLIDRMFERTHAGDSLLRCSGTDRTHLSYLDCTSRYFIAEPEGIEGNDEYEQPEDIREAIRDSSVAQAILRDLFRPVRHFGNIELRRQLAGDSEDHDMLRNPLAQAKAAMKTSHARDLQASEAQTLMLIHSDMKELRTILSNPWEDSAVNSPTIDVGDDSSEQNALAHARWFGLEGGFDPDV